MSTPAATALAHPRRIGPDAGAAAESSYEAIERDPDLFSPAIDLDAILPMLPVTLTSLEAWARRHAHAFSPAAQSAAS